MRTGFNLLLWCTNIGPPELKRIAALAQIGRSGVEVSILDGTPADHAALGTRPADMVANNYGYLFDSFHANIRQKDPLDAQHINTAKMSHVRVSEKDRGTPGVAHIDFTRMFATLRQVGWDGWLTVEGLPGIAAATRVWCPLFDDDAHLARDALALLHTQWNAAA